MGKAAPGDQHGGMTNTGEHSGSSGADPGSGSRHSVLDRVVERTARSGVVRPTQGRVALGVCRGIAQRLDIDPVVVRVIFGAAALFAGGLGFAAYLIAAMLLPDEDGRVVAVSALRHHEGKSIAWIALTAAVTISLLVNTIGQRDGGNFFTLAVVGGLCWWLWRRSPGASGAGAGAAGGESNAAGPAPRAGTAPAPAPRHAQDAMPVITPYGATAGSAPAGPYSPSHGGSSYGSGAGGYPTGPSGAPARAPLAPIQRPPRRRSLGGRLWLIAAGLAIVTFTATRAGLAAAGADPILSELAPLAATAVALGLLVTAVGLAGRRTSGLAGTTAVVAAIALLVSTAGGVRGVDATFGETRWTPASVAELKSEYSVGMGDGTLDLTRLPADELSRHSITLTVGMGSMKVLAPDDMTVTVDGNVRMGDLSLVERDGVTQSMAGLNNVGQMTSGTGPTLHISSTVGMGDTRIERTSR